MNTDRIAYFLAVVREGSFSAAAKNMYVSQTAISQQIASLEKEMGCALFHRLSTGAVLTDQGEQFLPYAERLMGIQLELQDAFADVHRVSAIHIGYKRAAGKRADCRCVPFPASAPAQFGDSPAVPIADGHVRRPLSRAMRHGADASRRNRPAEHLSGGTLRCADDCRRFRSVAISRKSRLCRFLIYARIR